MKTYHFTQTVQADGSLQLSGLPPSQQVEIVVLTGTDLPQELREWLADIRTRHPFAGMSKEQILQNLRQTREIVSAERHES